MDALAIQLRTKFIQLGLRIMVLLQLTSYMWPQDTPLAEIQICYDYIIVGCGTAGSILANRLTASGIYHVLVIEAGGDPPMESLYPSTFNYLPNSQYDWNFTSINDAYSAKGHRNHNLELTSGKMLGGDSSLGHFLYIRGDPVDYNNIAKIAHDSSWNYENMLPYFKKSEKLDDKHIFNSHKAFHGSEGTMGVTRHLKERSKKFIHAFKEAGNHIHMDVNGDKTLGYFEPMLMIESGMRQSMPIAFLNPIKHRTNLHILKETEVIEVNIEGNKATGVTAIKDGRIINIRARKEVIVSAGTMKSPQLLMLSGIGLTDHLDSHKITLKAHLPVGKHYQDQPGVLLVHKLKHNDSNNKKSSPQDPHVFPLPTIVGNVSPDPSKTRPEYATLNYIVPNDSDFLLHLCSTVYSFNDDVCSSLYNQTKGHETLVSKIVLLHPQSRGHLVIQSNDYKHSPMTITGFYSHDEDLESIINYIAHFLQVGKTNIYRKYGAELVYPRLKECESHSKATYWKCYALSMISTAYHYTGTCSIGRVVDSKLKVYGFEGLRVVDASVIPASTSGQLQAAVMAVAEKGADMILEDAGR